VHQPTTIQGCRNACILQERCGPLHRHNPAIPVTIVSPSTCAGFSPFPSEPSLQQSSRSHRPELLKSMADYKIICNSGLKILQIYLNHILPSLFINPFTILSAIGQFRQTFSSSIIISYISGCKVQTFICIFVSVRLFLQFQCQSLRT
jgi:hypothetical protein